MSTQRQTKTATLKKRGGVFQSIFLILCFLFMMMLVFMTFFMNQYVIRAQTEELDRSNQRVLQQVNETVSRLVTDLERQVRYFLSNSAMMQHLTNPQNSSTEQNIAILRELRHFTDTFPDVAQVWFYAFDPNTVMSSSGFLTSSAESSIGTLLSRHQERELPRNRSDLAEISMIDGGHLYIIMDFVPSHRLGSFVFQLNLARLQDIMRGDGAWAEIMVADARGDVFLSGGGLVPPGTLQLDLNASGQFFSDPSATRTASQRYYRIDAQRLGWHFFMEMTRRPALQDSLAFWMLTIPMLVVLIIIGTIGAYATARRIYTPINRLMNLVVGYSGENPPQKGDDIDYLASAYHQTLSANEDLQANFSDLGKSLRAYLCQESVTGLMERGLEGEKLLGLRPGGRFQVAMIRFGPSSVELDQVFNRKLQLSLAEKRLEQIKPCLSCFEDAGDLVVVLHYPAPFEAAAPSRAVCDLEEILSCLSEETHCRLFFGIGGCQDSFLLLRDSYHEAFHSLSYSSYMGADSKVQAIAPQDQATESRLRRLIEDALIGQEDIPAHCHLILEEIHSAWGAPEKRQRGYQLAENILMEKLLVPAVPVQNLPEVMPKTEPVSREEFLLFCSRALEQGRVYASKKKYQYVKVGKLYIEEHYMNSSLSINDISEHIGISPAYFSSLFNEITTISAVSYLNEVRVLQAQNLLMATRIPVKEVGFRSGFNSANVFGRVFKKHTGQSPKQFREQYLQNGEMDDEV